MFSSSAAPDLVLFFLKINLRDVLTVSGDNNKDQNFCWIAVLLISDIFFYILAKFTVIFYMSSIYTKSILRAAFNLSVLDGKFDAHTFYMHTFGDIFQFFCVLICAWNVCNWANWRFYHRWSVFTILQCTFLSFSYFHRKGTSWNFGE